MTLPDNSRRRLPDGRIDLPEVTLVAVTSVGIGQTLHAMSRSMSEIRFAKALLLTDAAPPEIESAGIEIVPIAPITSMPAYSQFMLNRLVDHIQSPFALCVQWDGYVIDAENWRDEFLEYDYIGAPWPHLGNGLIVGNGGFSLRSRRLLAATAQASLRADIGEDLAICLHGRALLESDYGIRFAPATLASQFSYERTPSRSDALGFHGVFNMPELDEFGGQRFFEFYRRLPGGLVRRIENRDLFDWAFRRGKVELAWNVLKYELRERGFPFDWVRLFMAAMLHRKLAERKRA